MYISRLHVEPEGFLAGLDLSFGPGLTVIIGARGTGKTSIIELIRFCLDAGGFTDDAVTRGRQQAMAVLGGGAVTVELTDPTTNEKVTVTRTSTGQAVGSIPPRVRATVLAQNEVEAVGAQAAGRLHLIDRFRESAASDSTELARIRSELESISAELHEVIQEGRALRARVDELANVTTDLTQARREQQSLLANAKASTEDQQRLMQFQTASNALAARQAAVDQNATDLETLRVRVASVANYAETLGTSWQADDLSQALTTAARVTRETASLLKAAHDGVSSAIASLDQERESIASERAKLEGLSSGLRQRLNALEEGVGLASRRVAELEERSGQLAALSARLEGRAARYRELAAIRDAQYDHLEAYRDRIFEARRKIADRVSDRLAPTVRVTVARSVDTDDYQSTIVRSLRGSGVHYNSVAPILAARVSPQELATFVEMENVDGLGAATGLSRDRTASLISALGTVGLSDIVGSQIEDGVQLELLDGAGYKASERLSIGQRCTVVLPMLLGANADPLLIDQPEDHLDNAFIADTLVSALRQRSATDQFIFSSHNANIPVLADADLVVVMESDGRRGFVSSAGPLHDPPIVSAVTSIMEGGAEAFERRSRFYTQAKRK